MGRTIVGGVALYCLLVALGRISWMELLPGLGVPAIWLPNGIALAVLVRVPLRAWAVLLPVVFAATATVDALEGTRPAEILLWSVGEVLEVAVGAAILRRYAGRDTTLGRLRDVLVLVVGGVLVGPLVGGAVAGISSIWLEGISYPLFIGIWMVIDGLGTFVAAPLVLTWTGPAWARPRVREALVTLATVVVLTTAFYLVFALPDPTLRVILLAFTTFPLLSWAGLRHGPSGAAATAAAFGAVALWQTLVGRGPFAPITSPQYAVFAVQGFMALVAFTALVLAAIGQERRQAEWSRNVLLDAANALADAAPMQRRLSDLVALLSLRFAPAVAVGAVEGGAFVPVAAGGTARHMLEPLRRTGELDTRRHEPSWLVLPLVANARELGTFVAASPSGISPDDRLLGQAVADRIAAALETDRLRQERDAQRQRIEESLARLDALLRTAPVGLALLDRSLHVIRMNDTLAAIACTDATTPYEGTLGSLLPEIGEALAPHLGALLETGKPVRELEVALARDGGRLHLLCSFYPVQVAGAAPLGVGMAVVDITARKQEEEALAASEERFRSLAQATAEMVWVTDAQGRGTADSTDWMEFTGQSVEGAVGWGWLEAIHPEDRERVLTGWRSAVARAEPYTIEYRLRRRDGSFRHIEARGAPVFNRDGTVREWVGMNFDISPRKEAEAERARLYAEAQDAIRARDDFLSVASHELKTPLTPLATRLQMIERKLAGGQPVPPSEVERARSSLERLRVLINDLLDTSQVQSARLAVRHDRMDLTSVVREAFEAATPPSPTAHHLSLEVPPAPVWVHGDRGRLGQVFASLIDNAMKFSPQGGEVRIRLVRRGNEAVVSVSDQGIGIPVDQQAGLFDRFFRARNVSAQSYGGLGLGLYIARDVVERHGGRIWLESELGRGSTFFVALPSAG